MSHVGAKLGAPLDKVSFLFISFLFFFPKPKNQKSPGDKGSLRASNLPTPTTSSNSIVFVSKGFSFKKKKKRMKKKKKEKKKFCKF